jgi:hypothetical protein
VIEQQIKRAAEEIRRDYLRENLREGTSLKWKILHVANMEPITDAAFRQLFTYLAHGSKNCDNITVGQQRLAMLLDRGERSVRRAEKELHDAGWITTIQQQRKEAKRAVVIPKKILDRIVFEVLDRTNVSGQAQHVEVPNLAGQRSDRTKMASQEVTKMAGQEFLTGQKVHFRPAKSDHITYIENLSSSSILVGTRASEADATELVEADFADFNILFNAWGKKRGDITPCVPLPRSTTDATLLGAIRGQSANPRKTVIAAARMTIVSMQARVLAEDHAKYGSGGFGRYFTQELAGTVRGLIEPKERRPSNNNEPISDRAKFAREREEDERISLEALNQVMGKRNV